LFDRIDKIDEKYYYFCRFIQVISCKEDAVDKPSKLIAEDKMIDVMYDLSILDAIKYQNPASLETYKINPSQYIYKSIKLTAHNLHKAISIMLLTIRTTKKCMMRLSNGSMQKNNFRFISSKGR
jgi:hypothetical protein